MKMKWRAIMMMGGFIYPMSFMYAQSNGLLYKKRIAVSVNSLEKQGDSIFIDLRFDMVMLNVSSWQSLTLVPEFRSPTGKVMELPTVVIKGNSQYKGYKRKMALMNEKERKLYNLHKFAVLKSERLRWNFRYHHTVLYEEWMNGATLEIKEKLYGCGSYLEKINYVKAVL